MTENELRKLGKELDNISADMDDKLQDYYLRLAESDKLEEEKRNDLYDEVSYEVAVLDVAASYLRKAHQKVTSSSDELESRMRDIEKSHRKRRFIKAAPANSVIDLREEQSDHFAKGMNFYKLFLVCFIGSFAGVVVELLWCMLTRGYIESRSGLVYGPFNLLYGAGAVMLMLALYRYRNRNSLISFFGAMIVGSAVEYACSWGQEMLFGSRSWDYSNVPFNLNGRICLLYAVFWGFLGVLWIKKIYPRMAKLILKIPNKVGKIVTWALVAFMVFEAAVTVVAVDRWSERINGVEASNKFEEFVDERFPDQRMERIFANMEFN